MKSIVRIFISLIITVCLAFPVYAQHRVFVFHETKQDERFQNLLKELRCLVCQNQDLLDSHADLAVDLQGKVFELMQSGKTNQEIRQVLKQRYGDFILFKPDFDANTYLLWFAPLIALCVGLLGVLGWWRRGRAYVE